MSARAFPRLRDYVAVAAAQGIVVSTCEQDRAGERFLVVMLRAPSGAHVVQVARELGEELASTSVARLDRGLGIKTGLFR
ncbi:hypothetical protein HT136_16750 [Novosphingobium profundi]|uniref:hypothetical protein n=1 Tax=Novosphingobium profundi TaxID=1774954 RepID=UPI001BD91B96|nr:hypothetical protein [Novosphingobium profundi]MBT0670016.1 hypothetical protein [Novosphingobium profundi]